MVDDPEAILSRNALVGDLLMMSSKQRTELRSDRNGRNLGWAMIGGLEAAASYGPKSALVLDEPVLEAWV